MRVRIQRNQIHLFQEEVEGQMRDILELGVSSVDYPHLPTYGIRVDATGVSSNQELKDILKKIGFSVTKAYGWVTTEKVLFKRMKEEDRLFYERLTKNAHKDIVLPIIAHANPNYGDAFCLEGTKK